MTAADLPMIILGLALLFWLARKIDRKLRVQPPPPPETYRERSAKTPKEVLYEWDEKTRKYVEKK